MIYIINGDIENGTHLIKVENWLGYIKKRLAPQGLGTTDIEYAGSGTAAGVRHKENFIDGGRGFY